MAKTAKRKRKPSAATAKRRRTRAEEPLGTVVEAVGGTVADAVGTASGIGTAAAVGRKAPAQTDRARACWAIRELYPRERYPRGVPDTVKPGVLHRLVAKYLMEHEPAELRLPIPSPRTTERARAQVARERL